MAAVVRVAAVETGNPWIRAQTEYAEVFTDVAPKEAVEFCVQYSAFRHALAEMLGERARALPPTVIVLFRSERDFGRYFPSGKRGEELMSVNTIADGVSVQGLVLNRDRERALRVAFEFETTWALGRAGFVLPLWAAQGTGKVFSTVLIRGDTCVVGDYHAASLKDWVVQPIPWPRFFEVNESSMEYRDAKGPNAYHSQTWALMHYLWMNDERGPERFRELVERLPREGAERALEAALGLSMKELTTRVKQAIGKVDRTRAIPFDAVGLRARVESGPADPAIVAVRVSDLLRGFLLRRDDADKELAVARAGAPEHPLVLEAMGRQAVARGDRTRALEHYREAIERGSRNVTAYLVSAESWLDGVSRNGQDEAGGGGIFADKAIADVRRALELEPRNDHAYRTLGRALFVRPEISEQLVEELAPGVALGDPTGTIRYFRALLFVRLKNNERYKAELTGLAAAPEIREELRQEAAERLGVVAYNELADQVEPLVASGKFDEAKAMVAVARKNGPRDATFEQRVAQVEQWIEGARQKAKAGK